MRKKLSNQFLMQYLVIFLLAITITILSLAVLAAASKFISHSLAKNRYPASSIMQDDISLIDTSAIVESGGGVQIINKTYQIVQSDGINNFPHTQLSVAEFTDFLIQSKRANLPYHYDIVYNTTQEFWLIVCFPTSLRINFEVAANKFAAPADAAMAVTVLAIVLLFYLFLLAIITFVYSRITAATITKPLHQLCEGTQFLREGDYSFRVDFKLKNEFAQLQDTFNAMAAKIEYEISLRKKAEIDRRQLILDICHDLKNPLASVLGYAELCLNNSQLTQSSHDRYLQVIVRNSQKANMLLNELFELSKLESPAYKLETTKTDLCESLRQIGSDLIPQFEQAGFSYVFEIPESALYVNLDFPKFSRIFQNLADNAIRYNSPDTIIHICVSSSDQQAVILFQDNGCGIPKNITEDIFKPFVRQRDSQNTGAEGSGLGLYIAKKLAQAHGGDLTLHSDSSRGCLFHITLPII